MPIEYKFDENLNCLLARFIGEVSQDAFEAYMAGLRKLPGLRAEHLRLTDLRPGTVRDALPTERVYGMADKVNKLDEEFPARRTALVADTDLMYGLAHIFLVRRDPNDAFIRLCRTMDEAVAWLELPPAVGDPFAPDYWDRQPTLRIE
jgi:hypothetical protein